MKKIYLLDFFRTGKLGSVEIGMTRKDVFAEMGEPDRWIDNFSNINKRPFEYEKAMVWGFGAIELCWLEGKVGLHEISFGVDALHWSSKEELDRWIFQNQKGESWTHTYLKEALNKEAIPYKDTGLDIIYHETEGYKVVPFVKDEAKEYDPEDIFGTVVLKSGVQVRYREDDFIIKISMPGTWLIKGSEQLIKW